MDLGITNFTVGVGLSRELVQKIPKQSKTQPLPLSTILSTGEFNKNKIKQKVHKKRIKNVYSSKLELISS